MLGAILKRLLILPLALGVAAASVPAVVATATSYPLYGQAYSPNIGWINFYCNNGVTDPGNPSDPAAPDSLNFACKTGVNYGVTYDSTTGLLSGQAYSPNWGWLDFTGVPFSMTTGLSGKTDAVAGKESLNLFGTTCFRQTSSGTCHVGNNAFYGVDFDVDTGEFSGYAYSAVVGYISFRRDDATAGGLYGGQNYGVKMQSAGIPPVIDENNKGLIESIFAKTPLKYTYGLTLPVDQKYQGNKSAFGAGKQTVSLTLPTSLGEDVIYATQQSLDLQLDPRQIDATKTYRLTFRGRHGADYIGSLSSSGAPTCGVRCWGVEGWRSTTGGIETDVLLRTDKKAPIPGANFADYEYEFNVNPDKYSASNWNSTTRDNYGSLKISLYAFQNVSRWFSGSVEIQDLKLEEVGGGSVDFMLAQSPEITRDGSKTNFKLIHFFAKPAATKKTPAGDNTTYSWTVDTHFSADTSLADTEWRQRKSAIFVRLDNSVCRAGTYTLSATNSISTAEVPPVDVSKASATATYTIKCPTSPVAECVIKTVDYDSATEKYTDFSALSRLPTDTKASFAVSSAELSNLLDDLGDADDIDAAGVVPAGHNIIPEVICTNFRSQYCDIDKAGSSVSYDAATREYTFKLKDKLSSEVDKPGYAICKFRFPTNNLGACGSLINYSTTATTTGSVTATPASCPAGMSGCNLPAAHTFQANGSKVFFFSDQLGRSATCHADVNWIDKRDVSLSNATSGTTGVCSPGSYSANWRNTESASATFSLSCSSSTPHGSSCSVNESRTSNCSLAEGNEGRCTVSDSASCTGPTVSYSYDCYCTSDGKGNVSCSSCTGYEAASCSVSDSCQSAGANVDKTPPTAVTASTASGSEVLWTPANFYNWSEWTKNDITAQIACSDALSGCVSPLYGATFAVNTTKQPEIKDVAENTANGSVTVAAWIDKEMPTMLPATPAVPARADSTTNYNAENTFEASEKTHEVTLNFTDGISGLRYVRVALRGDDGELIEIADAYERKSKYYEHDIGGQKDWIAVFSVSPTKAQEYALEYTVCDVAGNCNIGTVSNNYAIRSFLHVVAAAPAWSADDYTDCAAAKLANYSCVQLVTASEQRIADGLKEHEVRVELRDRFGNPVVSEAGIKQVKSQVNFQNTVRCNQVDGIGCSGSGSAKDGDAITYRGGEAFASGNPATQPMASQSTGLLVEADGSYPFTGIGDGKYSIFVASVAPTGNPNDRNKTDGNLLAYGPLAPTDSATAFVKSVKTNVSVIGAENDSAIAKKDDWSSNTKRQYLNYLPSLDAYSQALNFNGTQYEADATAIRNITVNAAKRFEIRLENQADSLTTPVQAVGLLIRAADSPNTAISWQEGQLEQVGTTNSAVWKKDSLAELFQIFTSEFVFPGKTSEKDWWNATPEGNWWFLTPSQLAEISSGAKFWLRVAATPRLTPGSTTPSSFSNIFEPYLKYKVGEKVVAHRTWQLGEDGRPRICQIGEIDCAKSTGDSGHPDDCVALGTCPCDPTTGCTPNPSPDEKSKLKNPPIQIIGTVNSPNGAFTSSEGAAVNQVVGDVSRNELKANIDRNVAALLQGYDAPCQASSGGGSQTTITNFNSISPSCLRNGVWMFDGDVILGESADPANTITLPDNGRTLLVRGGNVYIKSNIKQNAIPFGIVVLKGSNPSSGDVRIYPEVTNVAAAVYAEGALISMHDDDFGKPTTYFRDRTFGLRNQLYWEGLLATQNTIGGAEKDSLVCPADITCATLNEAIVYDLNYLRKFTADGGGQRAGAGDLNEPPGGANNNAAFIIRYDGRIATTPPPLFASPAGAASVEVGF